MKKSLKITILAAVLGLACPSLWAYSVDAITTSASFTGGQTITVNPPGSSVSINSTVCPGDVIPFSVIYSVSGPVGNTVLPKTLAFDLTTTAGPATVASSGFTTNHTFNAVTDTFTDTGSMTAPSTPGAYTVHVGTGGDPGNGGISGGKIVINFTVATCATPTPPPCNPVTPNLVVTDQCVLLHQTALVGLNATLTDPNTSAGISGKTITFKVDGNAAGSAVTNASGVATVSGYDVSTLSIGDHTVSVAWVSDDTCNYNDASGEGNLGVTYAAVTFQQPINADGSSVFKGGAIPVKIVVYDGTGAIVSDAVAHVFFSGDLNAIIGTDAEPIANTNGDSGNLMRWDPVAMQYIFNWNTTPVTNGTYKVWVDLGEGKCGEQHSVVLGIAKVGNMKGKK